MPRALLELAIEMDVAIKVLGGLSQQFFYLCHVVIVVLISLFDEAFRAEILVAISAVEVEPVLRMVQAMVVSCVITRQVVAQLEAADLLLRQVLQLIKRDHQVLLDGLGVVDLLSRAVLHLLDGAVVIFRRPLFLRPLRLTRVTVRGRRIRVVDCVRALSAMRWHQVAVVAKGLEHADASCSDRAALVHLLDLDLVYLFLVVLPVVQSVALLCAEPELLVDAVHHVKSWTQELFASVHEPSLARTVRASSASESTQRLQQLGRSKVSRQGSEKCRIGCVPLLRWRVVGQLDLVGSGEEVWARQQIVALVEVIVSVVCALVGVVCDELRDVEGLSRRILHRYRLTRQVLRMPRDVVVSRDALSTLLHDHLQCLLALSASSTLRSTCQLVLRGRPLRPSPDLLLQWLRLLHHVHPVLLLVDLVRQPLEVKAVRAPQEVGVILRDHVPELVGGRRLQMELRLLDPLMLILEINVELAEALDVHEERIKLAISIRQLAQIRLVFIHVLQLLLRVCLIRQVLRLLEVSLNQIGGECEWEVSLLKVEGNGGPSTRLEEERIALRWLWRDANTIE